MIHIKASLYEPTSPPACGAYSEGEKVIGWHIATQVVEQGEHKALLAHITLDDLCPKCFEEIAHLLFEFGRELRKEARE